MSTRISRRPASGLVALFLALAAVGPALAGVVGGGLEPIALVNPDFESDPSMSAGTPAGWTWNGLGNRGTAGGGTAGVMFFWQGSGSTLRQTSGHVVTAAGQAYTVTVDCRNSWNGSPKAILYVEDEAGRTVLGSASLPANGTTWTSWQTLVVSATTTTASIGKRVGVELSLANYPSAVFAEFDKVALAKGGTGGGGGGGGGEDPVPNPAATANPPDLAQGWIATRYNQIIADLANNPNRARAKVVFFGDSITQFWNAEGAATWTSSGFGDPSGPRYALNLGEAGDRTEHVLHRIRPAAEGGAGNLDAPDLAPKLIVLKIGINNTWSHTNDQIVGGIRALVEALAAKEPQASLLVVSILPHVEAARSRDRVLPINAAVKAWVAGEEAPDHVTYLDVYPAFVDAAGVQRPEFFGDGIHMTPAGYAHYASLLLPWVDSALADYESWADTEGLSGGPRDDDDGDGFANLHEYALRGDPKSAVNLPTRPAFSVVTEGGERWLELAFPRRSALGNRATYHLQVNGGLAPGEWIDSSPAVTSVAPFDPDFEVVTARLPAATGDRQFLRVLVEERPAAKVTFLFPEGRAKALVMSYDDGPASDRRLIDILDRNGIKGTFNLNSGVLGREMTWLRTGTVPHVHVAPGEVAEVYAGHEVASHTVSHPRLPELSEVQARAEIEDDIAALETLVGKPVRSFAYPFGTWNDAVIGLLREAGITNARTTWDTGRFCPPDNLLAWNPTTHDSKAPGLVDDFLALGGDKMAVFHVWGHSWEYDIDASERPWNTVPDFSWATFEAFCATIGGRSDIWYAGAGEVAAYLTALDAVVPSGNALINRSTVPVWIRVGETVHRLDPGGRLDR